ncbi:hypothetical protein CEUSTIGMA_g8358.t1 [Chlamydomonas eustigma]|uniref:Cytochrome b5 heme-binding domain-containing protein n=1 Tax=Chlamydomonas eustigma TaxID=1157962 RepID=A0A250XCV9_9CHLO|nr:hypothetical protein CEUSTIGMA_g8358.t1 [Chlamydomonas eustigma]|eukprot:GAX80923.1 hypothetical protein CEUSTIGMA_g8358.t1 [Chlamydomonas eustigma]
MSQELFTSEQLSSYNGEQGKPVYLAVRGVVYDVTDGTSFYGPGGAYSVFAGRECSRALAKMAVKVSECTDEITDLTEKQLQTLESWIKRFQNKYPVVGRLSNA